MSHFHNPNVKSEAKIHGYVPSNESAQIVILDKLKITNQAEFRDLGARILHQNPGKKNLFLNLESHQYSIHYTQL